MRVYAALALTVCLAMPAAGRAQVTDTVTAGTPSGPLRERRVAFYPIAGLHFGGPVLASVAGGIGVRSLAPGEPVRAFLLVEPGVRGARASLVTGSSFGALGSAWTVRASYLKFYKGQWWENDHAGVELQLIPLLGIGGRVGAFRPIRPPEGTRRRTLIIGDVSILL